MITRHVAYWPRTGYTLLGRLWIGGVPLAARVVDGRLCIYYTCGLN